MIKKDDWVICMAEKSTNYKRIGKVTCVEGEIVSVKYPCGETGRGKAKYYKLTSCGPIDKAVDKVMNLKEIFVRGLMSEPQKTFRKAGITNGDNLLTEEGTELFLNFLFQENSDKFKAVADEIVAEQEKENCK